MYCTVYWEPDEDEAAEEKVILKKKTLNATFASIISTHTHTHQQPYVYLSGWI